MFRIDDPSAAGALPTPEAAGTEGYFTEGNPGGGVAATLVRASFLNMLQEELRGVVVAGGLTPSKTTYNQLLAAIKNVAIGQFVHSYGISGYVKFPDGTILQWGVINFSTGVTASNTGFSLAFPTACRGALVGAPNTTTTAAVTSTNTTTINASTSAAGPLTVPYFAIGN